jgi:RNA recognition motif-containing protein
MEAKLFVGNLAYATTESELRQLFAQAGQVTHVDLRRDEHGQSRGFAFVVMGSAAQAKKAASMFNGYLLAERKLRVNAARPRDGNEQVKVKAKVKEKEKEKDDLTTRYQSKLGGFTIIERNGQTITTSRKSQYQSGLSAYGANPPPDQRPRRRGQRG